MSGRRRNNRMKQILARVEARLNKLCMFDDSDEDGLKNFLELDPEVRSRAASRTVVDLFHVRSVLSRYAGCEEFFGANFAILQTDIQAIAAGNASRDCFLNAFYVCNHMFRSLIEFTPFTGLTPILAMYHRCTLRRRCACESGGSCASGPSNMLQLISEEQEAARTR